MTGRAIEQVSASKSGAVKTIPLTKTSRQVVRLPLMMTCVLALSACDPSSFSFPGAGDGTDTAAASPVNVPTIEQDVEAPEVFQATDQALWDGRPSLGGIWVTAPGVRDPERVIIRNASNGRSVIGALYKRERNNPGPSLQLSSEAAAELGILAGQPTEVSVTALRRQEVPDPAAPAVTEATVASGEAAPAAEITATTLDGDPIAETASAAIDRAAASDGAAALNQPTAVPTPTPAPASNLSKPYVQIGIFSIENNARNTATALRNSGLSPTVLAQESRGKKFWRVIVGPATTAAERTRMLRAAKGLGFSDAYAVTN